MYRTDTSDEAQRVYDDLVRNFSDEERFLRGISLTHFCREIFLSEIRKSHPDASPQEVKWIFFEAVYGPEFSPEAKQEISNLLLK